MYSVPSGGPAIAKAKGAALIEFALTLPLYVAVLLAIIDFSNYLNDRSVLTAAAYNGAKAGAAKCNKPGKARKAATDAVTETLEGMLSPQTKSDPKKVSGSPKTDSVHRYVVTVQLDRYTSMLSLFTSTLPTFATLSATGVAVCQKQE